MTITREQVADLQPGDVVRIVEVSDDGSRYIHEGPVRADGGNALDFAGLWIRTNGGEAPDWVHDLTVVSRAPRPLYVNHPRTEPVPGDVVRDADDDESTALYVRHFTDWFTGLGYKDLGSIPARLRLLVDGDTGQVVP